jgi:hypothetical protein
VRNIDFFIVMREEKLDCRPVRAAFFFAGEGIGRGAPPAAPRSPAGPRLPDIRLFSDLGG